MFALSSSQEIVWLHEQLQPGSRAYNFTAFLDLWGTLDRAALRTGLAAVLDHHPGLRLELVAREGGLPDQRVREQAEPRLRTTDLSAEADPVAAFQRVLVAEAEEPLDTEEAPLLRWHLVRLGEEHHRLVHVEHHLIHDGHSFAMLLRDLFTVYRAEVTGERAELPATRSYEEHARAGAGIDRSRSLAFWQQELRDAPLALTLPGLARPGAVRAHRGGQLRQSIGADLAERLRARGRADGHTPFSVLLTLFGELLRRHSGHRELVVGTAVGNRPVGFESTVGMFVNTVPLRLRLDPAAPGTDSVDEVTDTLLRALPHQDVPVQELTRSLGLHTSGADNPLFSVMFSAHDAALPEIDVPGLEVTLYEGFNTGTTRFDLDLVLLPDDRRTVTERHGAGGMTLVWDYDADVFGEEVADLLAGRLLDLLRAYLDDPQATLAALAAPPAPAAPAATTSPAGPEQPAVLDPLTRQDPSTLAVIAGTERLTYGDLDRRVGELVERLRAAGVTAGQPVAALLPRGVDSVVALLACLRAGAVYAPLSPDDPAARLTLLLDRLNPALVLATRQSALALPAEGRTPALLDGPAFPKAEPAAVLDGAAYVIHTSGSTGVPKPVLVGRPALAGYVGAVARRYGLGPADRVLLFARPSFDVALEEVLPALAAGACLVLPQREVPTAPELVAVLAARGVTVANLPTSYFLAVREELREALRDGRWSPRLLVLGGERLPARALEGLLADTRATVLNAYGVTEATVTSTVHEITAADLAEGAEIPLGTELPGTAVHVLDEGCGRCRPAGSASWRSPGRRSPRATWAWSGPRPSGSSRSRRWAASGSTAPVTAATATGTGGCGSSAAGTTRSSCAGTGSSWRRSRPRPPPNSAAAPARWCWTAPPTTAPGWSASWRARYRPTRRRCTSRSRCGCPARWCPVPGWRWSRCRPCPAASPTGRRWPGRWPNCRPPATSRPGRASSPIRAWRWSPRPGGRCWATTGSRPTRTSSRSAGTRCSPRSWPPGWSRGWAVGRRCACCSRTPSWPTRPAL